MNTVSGQASLNSQKYWERKFLTGRWGSRGRNQTLEYAKTNIDHISLVKDFAGTILDYGCALGDAIPVYHSKYPLATYYGYDISRTAIKYCEKKHSQIAKFYSGNAESIPDVDIIIASHVMEHLSEDKDMIRRLLFKCKELFVFVPYMESPLYREHVNYYDRQYYDEFRPVNIDVFQVSYKQRKTLRGVIKEIVNFKFTFYSRYTKDIIMYHFKTNSLFL